MVSYCGRCATIEVVNAQLTGIATRRLAEVVDTRLKVEPVLVLHGPRTVGKSTLLAHIGARTDRRSTATSWSSAASGSANSFPYSCANWRPGQGRC